MKQKHKTDFVKRMKRKTKRKTVFVKMYENKKQKHKTVFYKSYETKKIRKTVFVKRVIKSTTSFYKVRNVFVKRVKKKQKCKSFYKRMKQKVQTVFVKRMKQKV